MQVRGLLSTNQFKANMQNILSDIMLCFDWSAATIFLRLFSLHYTALDSSNLYFIITSKVMHPQSKYMAPWNEAIKY